MAEFQEIARTAAVKAWGPGVGAPGAACLSHVADAVLSALADAGYEVVPKGSDHHVIEFREHGWTLQHPLSCRPDLFACPVNHAAKGRGRHELGRYECRLGNGRLIVGNRIEEKS